MTLEKSSGLSSAIWDIEGLGTEDIVIYILLKADMQGFVGRKYLHKKMIYYDAVAP